MELYASELLWIVIVGFIISFLLAFGVGANDVANSFGTSVGSGVLTFRQACILATICETSGSVLLGYHVSDTIRKGIFDVNLYNAREEELMLGMLTALFGSALWMFIATFLKLPVSTTHSIVGSTVGFVLVSNGIDGVKLKVLGKIVASWFISPLLSGLAGIAILTLIKHLIVRAKNPFRCGLIALPIIYGSTIFVNIFSVMLNGSKLLGMENLQLWMTATISVAMGLIVAIFCQFIIVPRLRRRVDEESTTKNNKITQSPLGASTVTVMTVTEASSVPVNEIDGMTTATSHKNKQNTDTTTRDEEDFKVNKLFHTLQTLTAMFSSFAHGGNDVSNAIGPLIAIYQIYREGSVHQHEETPVYMLFYGGIGMSLGMWIFGRRVNTTIGKNLTKIVPMSGFTIEFSSAITVLTASKLGIPISSTHCIVGSVVALGWVFGERDESGKRANVDWSLFRTIFYAWLVTLPAAGCASALLMIIFKYTIF